MNRSRGGSDYTLTQETQKSRKALISNALPANFFSWRGHFVCQQLPQRKQTRQTLFCRSRRSLLFPFSFSWDFWIHALRPQNKVFCFILAPRSKFSWVPLFYFFFHFHGFVPDTSLALLFVVRSLYVTLAQAGNSFSSSAAFVVCVAPPLSMSPCGSRHIRLCTQLSTRVCIVVRVRARGQKLRVRPAT